MKSGNFATRSFFTQSKVFLYALLFQTTINAQIVYPFVGSGTIGSADGTGNLASFSHPSGVAVDNNGDVYVADYWNNKIRKITSAGVVSTFAGSGVAGAANGTGAAASFNYPHGIAVDGSGNVYVADRNNHKIRKITSAGAVTTLAGSGTAGGTDGTGAAASFNIPIGVAVDASGNVYVADGSYKIRKITAAGVVTTLAGSGIPGSANGTGAAASFNNPHGVAVDGSGNVFVTDYANQKIRKITQAGVVTTFAGSGAVGSLNGTGTAASFSYPTGITIDGAGNLYVADGSKKIRKITSGAVVTTFAGSGISGASNGPALSATFAYITGISINPSGEALYIADYDYHTIRRLLSCFSTPPVAPAVNVTQPTAVVLTGAITITSPTGAFDYSIDDLNYQAGTSFTGLAPGIFQVTARHTASIGCVSPATGATITAVVPPQTMVGTICAGAAHSLFLCNDGSIKSWGNNNDGQLGNGTNGGAFESYVPVPVSNLSGVTAVYGGWGWNFALKNDGTVWAWGANILGSFGNGNTTSSNIPLLINTLTNVSAIAAAPCALSPLALKNDGTVLAWGSNGSGQLGNGTSVDSYFPVAVNSLTGITAVAVGASHAMALKNNGTVWAWGSNFIGQLGSGNNTSVSSPIQITALTNVKTIQLASNTSAILKNDGSVWTCGGNSNGELGNGTTLSSNVPVQLSLTNITHISAGNNFFLALKSDGTLWSWGRNNAGQLGIGTNVNSNVVVQVNGLTNVTSISAGGEFAHAIKGDGTVWSWGSNGAGQLGNGTSTQSKVPIQIPAPCGIVAGIVRNDGAQFISIYPNPSAGIFQIEFENSNSNASVLELYNVRGEKIQSASGFGSQIQIDLSAQPKGIYFIKICNGTNIYNKKIVVQ
ncbi:MAG: T9SS type A sorting domain-containing protein [Bacteroidota bacterium]